MTDERKLEIMNNILIAYRECLFSREANTTIMNRPEYLAGHYMEKWYSNDTLEDILEKDKEIFKKALEKQKEKIKERKRIIFKNKEEMLHFIRETVGFILVKTRLFHHEKLPYIHAIGFASGVVRSSGFTMSEVELELKKQYPILDLNLTNRCK